MVRVALYEEITILLVRSRLMLPLYRREREKKTIVSSFTLVSIEEEAFHDPCRV